MVLFSIRQLTGDSQSSDGSNSSKERLGRFIKKSARSALDLTGLGKIKGLKGFGHKKEYNSTSESDNESPQHSPTITQSASQVSTVPDPPNPNWVVPTNSTGYYPRVIELHDTRANVLATYPHLEPDSQVVTGFVGDYRDGATLNPLLPDLSNRSFASTPPANSTGTNFALVLDDVSAAVGVHTKDSRAFQGTEGQGNTFDAISRLRNTPSWAQSSQRGNGDPHLFELDYESLRLPIPQNAIQSSATRSTDQEDLFSNRSLRRGPSYAETHYTVHTSITGGSNNSNREDCIDPKLLHVGAEPINPTDDAVEAGLGLSESTALTGIDNDHLNLGFSDPPSSSPEDILSKFHVATPVDIQQSNQSNYVHDDISHVPIRRDNNEVETVAGYRCHTCQNGRTYKSLQGLRRHITRHKPGITSFKCTSCDKTYPRMSELKKHLPVHNPQLHCPHPGCKYSEMGTKKFAYAYNVRRHLRTTHKELGQPAAQ